MMLLNPVMLIFYQENGLGVKEFFLFQSIFYLTLILLEIPVGYFSDYISKKKILIISYIFFAMTALLWIFFRREYGIILAGEILTAISKVLMDNANSCYLYDYISTKNNDKKMFSKYGYLNFYLAAGTTCAAIVGTYLYSKFGSFAVLNIELLISILCILLIFSMPSISVTQKERTSLKKFISAAKIICKNKNIMNYIYYSGFLTAFSIVFALSFQPLVLKAMLPIALLGFVSFCNHGIRAIFSAITGKIGKLISLDNMIVLLYASFIIAFVCIFITLHCKNVYLILSLITVICVIIGLQLIFTIRHISRLHSFVSSENRGTVVSINNFFSRTISFVILFSSKIFLDRLEFENYYLFLFGLFIFAGFILMINTLKIKDAA